MCEMDGGCSISKRKLLECPFCRSLLKSKCSKKACLDKRKSQKLTTSKSIEFETLVQRQNRLAIVVSSLLRALANGEHIPYQLNDFVSQLRQSAVTSATIVSTANLAEREKALKEMQDPRPNNNYAIITGITSHL